MLSQSNKNQQIQSHVQNILRIISSTGRGILNVKGHMEMDGGKQLFDTEAGVEWLKERKQSHWSHLDLILNRNIFSQKQNETFCVRWETSESDVWPVTASFTLFTCDIITSLPRAHNCWNRLLITLSTASLMCADGGVFAKKSQMLVVSHTQTLKVFCSTSSYLYYQCELFLQLTVNSLHRAHGWCQTKIRLLSSSITALEQSCTIHRGAELCHTLLIEDNQI